MFEIKGTALALLPLLVVSTLPASVQEAGRIRDSMNERQHESR